MRLMCCRRAHLKAILRLKKLSASSLQVYQTICNGNAHLTKAERDRLVIRVELLERIMQILAFKAPEHEGHFLTITGALRTV